MKCFLSVANLAQLPVDDNRKIEKSQEITGQSNNS